MTLPQLFWNPLSITWLIEVIMALAIALHFVSRLLQGNKTSDTRYTDVLMTLIFIGLSFGTALQLMTVALPPVPANYVLPWVGPVASILEAAFVLFCFNLNRPREASKLPHYVLLAFLALHILLGLYVGFERHRLLGLGIVEYRDSWLPIPSTAIFVLCPIFLAWNYIRWQRRDVSAWRRKSVWMIVSTLCFPFELNDREADKIRAFFWTSLIPFSIGVMLFARSQGLIDWTTALVLACWLVLFFISTFALVYLNYVPEQTTFRTKLSGISLTGLLCVMSGVSWLVGPAFIEEYDTAKDLKDNTLISFQPMPDGSYQYAREAFAYDDDLGVPVADLSVPVALPFDFPFFGKNYQKIYLSNSGMVGFLDVPRKQDVLFRHGPQPALALVGVEMTPSGDLAEDRSEAKSGIHVSTSPDMVSITWNKLVSTSAREDVYTYQLRLHSDGRIIYAYKDMPERPLPDLLNPDISAAITGIIPPFENRSIVRVDFERQDQFRGEPLQGMFENRNTKQLEYLDRVFSPLANFTIGTSLVVLLIFSWFFTANLNRSLQDLLHGVRQIMSGNLKTRIDVRYRDEVGFLASSFNEMAEAQDELVTDLERKIAERTAEIERITARNARLEERNWLSQELHDAVSQTLFSANLLADNLPKLITDRNNRAFDTSKEIKKLNSDALNEMRELLSELRSPTKPTGRSFGASIEALIEKKGRKYPFDIDYEIEGNDPLPEPVWHAFNRILTECLNNAAKHSQANRVHVSFGSLDGKATLKVNDDGIGFDPSNVGSGSLGLKIMQERATQIAGGLEIDSTIAKGTRICLEWSAS